MQEILHVVFSADLGSLSASTKQEVMCLDKDLQRALYNLGTPATDLDLPGGGNARWVKVHLDLAHVGWYNDPASVLELEEDCVELSMRGGRF